EGAQLVPQLRQVPARDRVGDLVRLLDRIWRDRLERLLLVPGAAALGVAQPGHDLEEARELGRAGDVLVHDDAPSGGHEFGRSVNMNLHQPWPRPISSAASQSRTDVA